MAAPATTAQVPEVADADGRKRLALSALLTLAAGVVLWGTGWLVLRAAGSSTHSWSALWGLAGVSFLSSVVVPIPGVTATLLLILARNPVLGAFGVLGAAAGGTLGAALLLALGNAGRELLRRRATHNARARRALAWSQRFATRWTYVGVAVLLVPPFIPKLVVLYAAVLAHLRTSPFLGAVFVGVLLRNLAVLLVFAWGWTLLP